MKIAIEAQRIFRTNKHGMDFVALETIRELQKLDHILEYYIIGCPRRRSLSGRISQLPYYRNKMPDLSAMGTSCLTTSHSQDKTGDCTLHE